MKTVAIKNNQVIGVWLEANDSEYRPQYGDDIEVELSVNDDFPVYKGMTYDAEAGTFAYVVDPEIRRREEIEALTLYTRRSIFSKAPETAQLTALMDAVIDLYDRLGFELPPTSKAVLDIVNDGLVEHAEKMQEILKK